MRNQYKQHLHESLNSDSSSQPKIETKQIAQDIYLEKELDM
jgi:hypothetical protein